MADPHRGAALRRAVAPACLRRSLVVALIVGTLLNAINQGDRLLTGGEVSLVKLALTYVVPFCVATYGAYSMARNAGCAEQTRSPVTGPERGRAQ